MIDVQAENGVARMAFATEGLFPDQVDDFVTWLRLEGIACQSRLSEAAA